MFVHGATECKLSEFVNKIGGVNTLTEHLKNGLFETELVLSVLAEFYHTVLETTEPIPLAVILDNYQFTINKFPKEWKEIAKSLGRYMCESHDKNQRTIRDQLVIPPVIAGTIPKGEIALELTLYGCRYFPLPPFTYSHIFTILEHEKIPKNVYDSKEKKRFWSLMGMIPRSLQWAVQIVRKEDIVFTDSQEEDKIQNLFKLILKDLDTRYGAFLIDPAYNVLFYCLNGEILTDDIEWANKLHLEGKIHLDGQNRILVPYPYFVSLISRKDSGLARHLFPDLISQFYWQTFESLVMRIFWIHLHYKSNETIFVSELFPGAHMTDDLETYTISPQKVGPFRMEKKSFLKGTRENMEFNNPLHPQDETIISLCNMNNLLVDGTILTRFGHRKSLVFDTI
jgi:hypothetical protein